MFYSNIYLLIYIYMITKSRFIYNLLLLNSLIEIYTCHKCIKIIVKQKYPIVIPVFSFFFPTSI